MNPPPHPPLPSADRAPRVLFVVPGHQVAHDGITDYTFWLVAAAGRAGVNCLVFALHPFDDSREGYTSRFPAAGPGRLTVRLATACTLRGRIAQLKSAQAEFKPDWVSIQFTPGTFREGRFFLPGLLALARIFRGQTPVCLTAHESARVLISARTWRDRALGRLRRFEIETGLRQLRPAKVFASNPQHYTDLTQAGFKPRLLPIISNIPRTSAAHSTPDSEVPPGVRIALVFGRIAADWDPAPVLAALSKEADATARPIVIVSIGEVGHRGLGWQAVVQAATALGLSTYQLGPLAPDAISAWLQRAAYGLSPTPFAMWQKSSTCAAMLIHEVPLIFSDEIPDGGQPLPPRFAVVRHGLLHWVDAPADRRASHATADELWAEMKLFPR